MDLCKAFRNIKPVKGPTGLEVQKPLHICGK